MHAALYVLFIGPTVHFSEAVLYVMPLQRMPACTTERFTPARKKFDGTLEIHKRFIFLQSDCCNVVYVLFGCGCIECHYLHRDGQKATPLSGTHPGRRDKATHEIQQQVKSRV